LREWKAIQENVDEKREAKKGHYSSLVGVRSLR
jgi:hypothetical protein